MREIDLYQQPAPTCPHCGYALDSDDMNSDFSDDDLWSLAPDEGRTSVQCPQCDNSYWVQGGYKPHYTSACSDEELM